MCYVYHVIIHYHVLRWFHQPYCQIEASKYPKWPLLHVAPFSTIKKCIMYMIVLDCGMTIFLLIEFIGKLLMPKYHCSSLLFVCVLALYHSRTYYTFEDIRQ